MLRESFSIRRANPDLMGMPGIDGTLKAFAADLGIPLSPREPVRGPLAFLVKSDVAHL